MQQTAPAVGAAARGCYKCGQSGHWARDCTVPQSQWLPRQPGQPGRPAGGVGGARAGAGAGPAPAASSPGPGGLEPFNLDAEGNGQAPVGQTAAALRKEKRKRPKLTVDMLKGPKGLPDVYLNFPDAFRRQFKGRGHEASDLRRLLEMYKRWQDRIFPHGEFDAFICTLERISGTNVLKHHMREKRAELLREVQDIADPPHVQLEEAEALPAGAGGAAGAAAGAAAAELEEEEEMLMLVVEEGGYEDEHPEVDDELLELLEEEPLPGGPRPQAGAAAAAGPAADEDEELLQLVIEGEEEYLAAAEAAEPTAEDEEQLMLVEEMGLEAPQQAAAAAAATATQIDEEEEERRLLALAADDEGEAGWPSQSILPGSTGTVAASRPGPAASGLMAETVLDSEDQALLEMLNAQLLPSQPGGGAGTQPAAAAAAAAAQAVAAQVEVAQQRQRQQLEPSPLLGAGTEEQPAAVADAGAGAEEEAVEAAAQRAAAAMEPSLELCACTEEQVAAPAFEPSPLLGECTEEQLANPTDERIAFKVKTTAPQKYSVKPAAGILEAQGNAQLAVTMAAPKSPLKQEVKDRFLVEALAVGPEVAAPTSELFKANAGSVSSTKLRVAWLEPKKGGGAGGSSRAPPAAAAAIAAGKARTPPPAAPAAAAGTASAGKQQPLQQLQKSPAVPAAGGLPAAKVSPAPGKVIEYVPEEEWWLVKYEDRDDEHIDFKELQRILVAKPSRKKAAQQAQQEQQAQPAGAAPSSQGARRARPDEQASASPTHSALVSHHTELAHAGAAAEDTAGTAAQPAAVAPVALAVGPSAAKRLPTHGARMEDVLKAQQRQHHQAEAGKQQKQPGERGRGQQPAATLAEQPPSMGVAGGMAAEAPGAAAAAMEDTDGPAALAAGRAQQERQRQQQQQGCVSNSIAVETRPASPQQWEEEAQEVEQHEQQAGRPEEEAEEEAEEEGLASASSEDDEAEVAAEDEAGAESDPDFVLEEELLPEEVEEQRWMAEQCRLRGLSSGPGSASDGEGGGGVAKRAGRRRRSSAAAAAAAAAAVVVKQERQEQLQRRARPQRQEEVVDLLSDSDADIENVAPAARGGTQKGGAARPAVAPSQPRTKAVHPTAAHPTLRLTFASALSGDVLAEVRVRGCTPLRSVAAALAARCLEGGSEADGGCLQLSLEGSTALLEHDLTVKTAGLQDGSCVIVGLQGADS
ncbi:hypothetical protein ABPG75_011048 [Micractinium tetrahymenae]